MRAEWQPRRRPVWIKSIRIGRSWHTSIAKSAAKLESELILRNNVRFASSRPRDPLSGEEHSTYPHAARSTLPVALRRTRPLPSLKALTTRCICHCPLFLCVRYDALLENLNLRRAERDRMLQHLARCKDDNRAVSPFHSQALFRDRLSWVKVKVQPV